MITALGCGHQRVEQQLTVLPSVIALPDPRGRRQQVVAVARRLARKRVVVETEQAHDPVGHGSHRLERADREVAGSEVGARWPTLRAARPGGPGSRRVSARSPAAGGAVGLGDQVVEHALQLGSLPAVAFGVAVNASAASASASAHSESVCERPRASSATVSRSISSPTPPGELDRADCRRRRVATPARKAALVLGHRRRRPSTRSSPVSPGPFSDTCCKLYRPRCAASRPHRIPRVLPPSPGPARVVVVEPDRRRTGLAVGEIEHL